MLKQNNQKKKKKPTLYTQSVFKVHFSFLSQEAEDRFYKERDS